MRLFPACFLSLFLMFSGLLPSAMADDSETQTWFDHGRGQIVAFSEGPVVRAYLDGLNDLLVNAVRVAPSYSLKLR